jgi:3'-phosphoadenosine 5'-phosphosulfate sulfotransferase (PAPS reductase)/FAD synthetase
MPRPAGTRKDMSEGWRELHRNWAHDLDSKVEEAHRLLDTVLDTHRNPIVCWSGGKDSTVVLHLALQHRPHMPVVYVDSGVEFPETVEFVRALARPWNLNLVVVHPEEGEAFWDVGLRYGWPMFGKGIASNVGRARRTGNIRLQLSELERTLALNDVRVSARCTRFIQEKPSKRAEQLLGADVKLVGLRASESRARARLWVDHGDYYFVKRYYGRGKGMWKANPIALWTDDDIWEYTRQNGIPHCSLYDKGYTRNGCWSCAMGVRHGQLKRLRLGHPELFAFLMTETEMGKELLRAKLLLSQEEHRFAAAGQDMGALISRFPDFFDRL